jgi:hypothetical protein
MAHSPSPPHPSVYFFVEVFKHFVNFMHFSKKAVKKYWQT